MIKLFNIPNHVIDTSKFKNILHDSIRTEYEQAFAEYVGAKYAVAVTSCTDAIFLTLKSFENPLLCQVPSLVTTRFLNAIIHAGCKYNIVDDVNWVGNEYTLYESSGCVIIDSAQKVERDQYKEYWDNDIIMFSNYPTKPIGGLRGGVVVSNNKGRIDWIRQASFFGEKFSVNSWEGKTNFVGWQMFMDSVQAYIAMKNLKSYQYKRNDLDSIRERYKKGLQKEIVTGDSYHLFRVRVSDNEKCLEYMKQNGVICGIHYKPIHLDSIYNFGQDKLFRYPESEKDGKEVISIPFNETMDSLQVTKVINLINKFE